MIRGAAKQISKYKNAVGKINVGNKPTAQVVSKAKATSLGRNRSSVVTNAAKDSVPKGSWEGYMGGSSAPIQMNGTGYLSPLAKKARGIKSPKSLIMGKNGNPIGMSSTISRNVFDYTYRSYKGSSKERLASNLRLNRML